MRGIFLFITIVTGVLGLRYVGNHVKNHVTHDNVHKVFHNHYTHNGSSAKCPNFKTDMEDASMESTKCIHENLKPEKQSVCHFIDRKLGKCLQGPKNLLDKCLPDRSKGVPDLVMSMMFGLLDFVCKAKGSELFELTNPCITLTLSDQVDQVCLSKLQDKAMEMSSKSGTQSISREEICQLIRTLRTCLKDLLEEYCTSPISINNFFKFFDTLLAPCKKLRL